MGDHHFSAAYMDTEEEKEEEAQYISPPTKGRGKKNIFEDRFMHAQELFLMGSEIEDIVLSILRQKETRVRVGVLRRLLSLAAMSHGRRGGREEKKKY